MVVVTVCVNANDGPGTVPVVVEAGTVVSGGFSGGAGCELSLWFDAGGASSLGADVSFGLGVACRGFDCMAAMAALRSTGHTDDRTFKGTWTSKVRHMSIICCGGSRPK